MFKFVVKRNTKELFHRAVADSDFLRVKMLLEHALEDTKFNIDDINDEGLTALQNSCFTGNIDIVKLLVRSGGNIKIKDRDGWTLLHAAAMTGKIEIVTFLVESGLSVTLRNDKKQLPIDFADDMPVVMFLLKRMLESGLEQEVHRYIKRNPHLKKEIYKEVESTIHTKRQEIKALERLPYTPAQKAKRRASIDVSNSRNEDRNHQVYFVQGADVERDKHLDKQSTSPKYFTLDLDDLPATPNMLNKRWSSMSNIPVHAESDYSEVKIHMHNGYETDGTERHLAYNNNKINRNDFCPGQLQGMAVEAKEIDIASVNSHSTSGYETDDVDHLFLHHAKKMVHSESDSKIVYGHNNNNQFQKRSKTMSPRTVRRLEHRFGSLVLDNDKEPEFERKNMNQRSENFKRVEYPEVFL